MAIAKKCDICGNYYEPYSIAISGPEAKTKHNGLAFVSINNEGRYFSAPIMDCCPGCLESIKRHIDGLKGENYGKEE